jgi:hypothetical protein
VGLRSTMMAARLILMGLRKRTTAACSENEVEAAMCSKAGDEAAACSGVGIKDSRQRWHDDV